MFDQHIGQRGIAGREPQLLVDVSPGAASDASHGGPSDDPNVQVCNQPNDVSEHSDNLLVRQVHPLCDADRNCRKRGGLHELG